MRLSATASRAVLTLAVLFSAAAVFGCGSGAPGGRSEQVAAATIGRSHPAAAARAAEVQRLRRAVVRGAARDFAIGNGIGGHDYEACVLVTLRDALDRAALARLVQVYRRPDGQQFAAQALNRLAVPLGAACGHPFYVPELVEASRGLADGRVRNVASERLGIAYGPYLGVRCRHANHHGCDRVGLDVVFGHAATRVLALIGDRRLRLHTPGMHDGVRYRDWVGTFAGAGLERPGSPLEIPGNGRSSGIWAGYPPVYVPVEFDVAYADGRHVRALLPRVFLSPGWG